MVTQRQLFQNRGGTFIVAQHGTASTFFFAKQNVETDVIKISKMHVPPSSGGYNNTVKALHANQITSRNIS